MSERHRAGPGLCRCRRPGPLAEDPKPAQRSAPDVQSAPAGYVAELREELAPGGLPHPRLKLQALQLRGLVGEQVALLRHRLQYLPSGMRPQGAPAACLSQPMRAHGLAQEMRRLLDASVTTAPDEDEAFLGVGSVPESGCRRRGSPPRRSFVVGRAAEP